MTFGIWSACLRKKTGAWRPCHECWQHLSKAQKFLTV
jgi:hypothetical protein